MAYDIPTLDVRFKLSLPEYVVTTDGIPVTTDTTDSAQVFSVEK